MNKPPTAPLLKVGHAHTGQKWMPCCPRASSSSIGLYEIDYSAPLPIRFNSLGARDAARCAAPRLHACAQTPNATTLGLNNDETPNKTLESYFLTRARVRKSLSVNVGTKR